MELFNKAGFLIWPILIESVIALFIIIERCFFLLRELPLRRRKIADLEKVSNFTSESDPLFAMLKRAVFEKKIEKRAIDAAFSSESAHVFRNLSGLTIIAQSAPLLGLLGTVTGMIRVFMKIAELSENVRPSDLASGIWEALLTTAAGLMVAIPSVIAYNIFLSIGRRYLRWLMLSVNDIFKRSSVDETVIGAD